MLELPATLTIEKLEEFIEKVNSSGAVQPLNLPIGKKNIAFGAIAMAVQAVNTWANVSTNKKILLTRPSKNEIQYLPSLVEVPYKFAAAMMSKDIFYSNDLTINVRREINNLASEAIDAQSNELFGQNHGRLCWYSFIDHSTKGFDSNFYLTSSLDHAEPRGLEQIRSIVSSMVYRSSSVAGGSVKLDDSSTDELGRIFYELFINTHEHGSRDINRSKWLRPGNRMIYTYGINLSDSAVKNSQLNNKVLKEYINGLKASDKSTRRFIELSIIDSGLGFYGRWLADHPEECSIKNADIKREYEIIKKCLKFRSSSTKDEIKGNGLPSVMASLTRLNGFMKIRSNRTSIYRDFNLEPYMFNLEDDCVFMDWETQKNCNDFITECPNARGVSITILIPLSDRNDLKEEN